MPETTIQSLRSRVARNTLSWRKRDLGNLPQDVDHLHGDQQSFVTFVGVLGTGAIHRLLHIIGSQNAKTDGDLVSLYGVSQAAGNGITNVIEMGRITADDRAQAH